MVIEAYYQQIFLAGVIGLILGVVWILIAAFVTHWKWGLAMLAFPPVVSILFAVQRPRRGIAPALLILAALAALSLPAIMTRVVAVDLGPFEIVVNGQRQVTLTDWDRKDYSFLKYQTDIVVLQMANADVTDQTLELLVGLQDLKELDISHSQVTNAGLARLAALPKLEILRVAGTQVSDEGFKQHLLAHPALVQIDASATAVSSEFIDWCQSNTKMQIMN